MNNPFPFSIRPDPILYGYCNVSGFVDMCWTWTPSVVACLASTKGYVIHHVALLPTNELDRTIRVSSLFARFSCWSQWYKDLRSIFHHCLHEDVLRFQTRKPLAVTLTCNFDRGNISICLSRLICSRLLHVMHQRNIRFSHAIGLSSYNIVFVAGFAD